MYVFTYVGIQEIRPKSQPNGYQSCYILERDRVRILKFWGEVRGFLQPIQTNDAIKMGDGRLIPDPSNSLSSAIILIFDFIQPIRLKKF
jgi:hypothetical protein